MSFSRRAAKQAGDSYVVVFETAVSRISYTEYAKNILFQLVA